MLKKKNNFKKIGAVVLSTAILAGGIFPIASHAEAIKQCQTDKMKKNVVYFEDGTCKELSNKIIRM
ncbi:hypothetical protein ER45_030730 (plasmid) [Bacillus mycoides]|nr:hypothetical protein ER45_030730 [Bacillus mycoides]